jgi:aryl-alcohol dehydrogenase-like predicted oxidoreductase
MVYSPLGGGVLTGKYRLGEQPPADSRAARVRTNFRGVNPWASMLTERNLRIADEVGKVAAELGTKSTAVAIAWVLARRGVTSVIIGPRTLDQYEQNMEGFRVELDDDAVHKLNQVSRPEQ